METIGSTLLIGLGLVLGLSYFVMCHAVSVIARKTEHGDTAEILAYVPGLQVIPMIWVGGGSVLRFLIFGFALLLTSVLLGFAAGKVDGVVGAGMALFASTSLAIASTIYFTVLTWRTAVARDLPGWFALLMWLPGISFFVYPIMAFHDGWARPHKVGATLGLLLTLGITAPFFFLAKNVQDMDLSTEMVEWSEGGGLETLVAQADPGALDPMPTEVVVEDPTTAGGAAAAMPTEVGLDHDKSIRALFELKGRFEALDSLTDPANMRIHDHRNRALALVTNIRTDLESLHGQLDPETYDELANHLVRVEAEIHGHGSTKSASGGSMRIASAGRGATDGSSAGPAAPAMGDPVDAAPIRPFPVQVSDACPVGTELRSREGDKGDEEWCQQLAQYGGLRHGWYARYFEGGRPEQVGEYRDGLRVGVWTRFRSSGEVRAQAEFDAGLQHGWLLTFDATGERQKAIRFDRGTAVR